MRSWSWSPFLAPHAELLIGGYAGFGGLDVVTLALALGQLAGLLVGQVVATGLLVVFMVDGLEDRPGYGGCVGNGGIVWSGGWVGIGGGQEAVGGFGLFVSSFLSDSSGDCN